MSNILILTATITPPPGVPGLNRTNPSERMNDYCKALSFYCRRFEQSIDRIVFIENSATDLAPLRKIVQEHHAESRVELVSFNGLDHSPKCGRGYGEFKLLDHAMEHSQTLANSQDEDRLWKVTGRYCVLNLGPLIRHAPADYELYCDMRDHPIPWVDLRVFSATVDGYRKLLRGIYAQLREDRIHMAPERFLRPLIGEMQTSNRIITRFNREPHVDGIRGLDSKNYSSGKNLLKYWVRATQRYAQPMWERLNTNLAVANAS